MKNSYLIYKRIFDLVGATLLLILLAPLIVLIGLSILVVSPGKVLFIQKRLGEGGKLFDCYKFRTMVENAIETLPLLLQGNATLQKEWQVYQKLSSDPRIFGLGKWLRKTSLDELPQLFNVLKGDLSLVGPRPYMVSQEEKLGSYAAQILSVKPGITGLWQTSGRSCTTFQERIILDARYVEEMSFWYDLQLMGKTIPEVLFSKHAN